MRRSDTMKMPSLKSSRSSVHEIMGTKKFDDHAEAVSSIPRSVSMNFIGGNKQRIVAEETIRHGNVIGSSSDVFTFRELAIATENFSSELLVGEGGFGRVYKGFFKKTNQIVAVKQLDRNGVQGNKEFLVEVLTLSLCHHPNLINLKGYCADGQQRILVYEYMHNGSLDRHLYELPASKKPLDWYTRMQIAKGAAQGLDYLHYTASPPIIYRDFKTSNILLDERFNPKLSGFGLARFGRMDGSDHAYTRVMVTSGYCAPESQAGELTAKSDIYSFGVVLLEIISGRRAVDNTKPLEEENLVAWAKPLFKDRRKYKEMADPLLEGKYPIKGLYQALAIAAMCLQDEPITRPFIGDIVVALEHLSTPKDEDTDEEDGRIE